MDKIKVMIIDKQAIFRAGVRGILSQHTEFETLDSIPGEDTLNLIEKHAPDVILIDIDPPSLSGLELGRNIKRYYPSTKIIVLSPTMNNEELFETIKIGAVAYLDKNSSSEELLAAVNQAFHGEYPINDSLLNKPTVAERVLRQFQDSVLLGKTMESITAPLTNRETQVLKHIADGNSNKQIAQILDTSEQTVKNQVSSILRKLNANDRAHAIVMGIRRGLISLDN